MTRKLAFPLLFLLLSLSAFAQTTYTTTADACFGKANQFCTLPVSANPANGITQITLDSRSVYYPATLSIGGWGVGPQIPGQLSGFVGNPDGSKDAFYGVGSFASTDGTVTASFQFYAYYVKTCSGRGCGGTLGWHYRILAGSTVTQD